MAAFKGVLLDLGGVIYVGDQPLPGAVDAVGRLRDAGIAVRFLTNTTRTARRALREKLFDMGLAVFEEELFTPALAVRRVIEERGLSPHLLVASALREDFAGLVRSGERQAVVVGDAGDGFTYKAMNAAYRLLEDGADFLALGNNRSFRDADGGLSLDAGAFVTALAFASRREPTVFGKPAPEFFRAGLSGLGCAPGEAVMIGDDVENDVAGAMAAGLAGILVRTGKYKPGAELLIDPPPLTVAKDLPEVVDWILSERRAPGAP